MTNPASTAIRSLKSSKEGKLLITLGKNKEALVDVKTALKNDNGLKAHQYVSQY